MNRKRLIYILLGPALLGLCTVGLKDIFGTTGAGSDRCRTLDDILVVTRPVLSLLPQSFRRLQMHF